MTNKKYWEEETPEVITTPKNVLRHYPKAGRLQVARPDFDFGGERRMGKSVSVDLLALAEAEPDELAKAIQLFENVLDGLRQAASVAGAGARKAVGRCV